MDDTNTALKGTIKTWFEERGFGWIARDDGAPDIFLHVSDVAGDFEPNSRRPCRIRHWGGPKRKADSSQSHHLGGQGRRAARGKSMSEKNPATDAGLTQVSGTTGLAFGLN